MAIQKVTDAFVPVQTAGDTYEGNEVNQTYSINPNLLQAGAQITIIDQGGTNKLELVGGLQITKSVVVANEMVLTLSNGAVVNIRGANTFDFVDGGNTAAGIAGQELTFPEFVVAIGSSIPAAGAAPTETTTPVTISTGGGTGSGTGTFTLTNNSTGNSVNEGSSVEFTITANSAVTADTAFTYALGGTEVTPDDFTSGVTGTATILSGQTTATFTADVKSGDGSEFDENFTVEVKDSAGATVGGVATLTIPGSTEDTTAPTVTAPASKVTYAENSKTDADVLATIAATDAVGVTGFEISSGNDSGFYEISATGEVSLTAAGVAGAASDYEATPNDFALGIKAMDASGNKSSEVTLTLEVTDVDDVAPTFVSALITGSTVKLSFNESLDTTKLPANTDFIVGLKNGAINATVSGLKISGTDNKIVEFTVSPAPGAGETYTVSYTPGTTPLQDTSGNAVGAISATDAIVDTAAPVITASQTFSYVEEVADETTDVLGTVAVTDDTGAVSFAITAGNTDGFFAISNTGAITLTTAGLTAAANDFEATPNSFGLTITATDGAGNTSAAETVTLAVTDDGVVGTGGNTFTLTAFDDTGAAFVGTSADDVYNATAGTLNSGDILNGNGGNDRLNALGVASATTPTLTDIDTISIRSDATTAGVATDTFLLTNATGYTSLINDRSLDQLAVTGISSTNVSLEVKNAEETSFIFAASAVSGSSDAVNLTITGANTGGDISDADETTDNAGILIADVETINITGKLDGTTAASTLELTALEATTINFVGAVAVDAGFLSNTSLTTTISGAGMTAGGFEIETPDTGAFTVTGSNFDDTIAVSADNSITTNATIALGSGEDTLKFAFGYDDSLDYTTALGATGALNNVTGIDVIAFDAGTDSAATGTKLDVSTSFGSINKFVLSVGDGSANNDSAEFLNLKTDVEIVVETNNQLALLDMETFTGSGVKDAALTLEGGTTLDQFDSGVIGTLTIHSNTDTAGATALNTISDITDVQAATIVIDGAQAVLSSVLLNAASLTVDASALTGNLTLTTSASATLVKGGTAIDTITGAAGGDELLGNAGNDVLSSLDGDDILNGGAGNDRLLGGDGTDTLTGGEGVDTFVFLRGDTVDDNDTITDGTSSDIYELNTSTGDALNGTFAALNFGTGAALASVADDQTIDAVVSTAIDVNGGTFTAGATDTVFLFSSSVTDGIDGLVSAMAGGTDTNILESGGAVFTANDKIFVVVENSTTSQIDIGILTVVGAGIGIGADTVETLFEVDIVGGLTAAQVAAQIDFSGIA